MVPARAPPALLAPIPILLSLPPPSRLGIGGIYCWEPGVHHESSARASTGVIPVGGTLDLGGLPTVDTLRVRRARPAAAIDTELARALHVLFTSLAMSFATCPDRGATIAVAKPIAALVIGRARSLGHIHRPSSLRTIIQDGLVLRRGLQAYISRITFGVKYAGPQSLRRRRHPRRRRTRCIVGRRWRCCGPWQSAGAWIHCHRMRDTTPSRRLLAR
jgi:hypothetical protein